MCHCLTCDNPIARQFWLCAECEAIYGSSVNDWPDWVRFLINDSATEKRAQREDIDSNPPHDEPHMGITGRHSNGGPMSAYWRRWSGED